VGNAFALSKRSGISTALAATSLLSMPARHTEAAQLIAKTVGSADDRIVDHLQGDAPGAHRGLPASHENP
jgi:hypothetical protein